MPDPEFLMPNPRCLTPNPEFLKPDSEFLTPTPEFLSFTTCRRETSFTTFVASNGVTLGSLWGHFGVTLALFWVYERGFGSLLDPFWGHFGHIDVE